MESNGPSQPRDEEPLTPGSATKVPLVRTWLREDWEAGSLGHRTAGCWLNLRSPYLEERPQLSGCPGSAWGSVSLVSCFIRYLA